MEELFYKYNVDIYFTGHIHSYERTWPTFKDTVLSTNPNTAYINPLATIYFTFGGAGNDEMEDATIPELNQMVDSSDLLSYNKRSKDENGPWSANVDLHHFGIGKVTVINATTLKVDYIQTSIEYIYDSIIIKKN